MALYLTKTTKGLQHSMSIYYIKSLSKLSYTPMFFALITRLFERHVLHLFIFLLYISLILYHFVNFTIVNIKSKCGRTYFCVLLTLACVRQHRRDARAAGMALVSAGVECRPRGRVKRERAFVRVLRVHISGWTGEERGMARR